MSKLTKEQEEYLRICEVRNNAYLKSWSEKNQSFQKEIEKLSKELMLTIRSKNDAELQIITFESAINKNKEKYLAEFDALKNLASYEYIEPTKENGSTAFKGRTVPVEIEDKGKTYEMGQYDVIIQNGTVKIYKEGHRGNHAPHPHVSSQNVPCLGDASQSIPKLVAGYEYAIVFDMIYKFLCSYNSGSPYVKIEQFKVKKERNKK